MTMVIVLFRACPGVHTIYHEGLVPMCFWKGSIFAENLMESAKKNKILVLVEGAKKDKDEKDEKDGKDGILGGLDLLQVLKSKGNVLRKRKDLTKGEGRWMEAMAGVCERWPGGGSDGRIERSDGAKGEG